jgi:adenylate kinase
MPTRRRARLTSPERAGNVATLLSHLGRFRRMRIVLLGAPGSGKGTQAQRLAQERRMPQISTGDLLRAAVASSSSLGKQAKAAMDAGSLVEDAIVLGIIAERLGAADVRQGFVLDGFPRNLEQATALDAMLEKLGQPLDLVVLMDVDRAELVRRISGRRTCRDCGRVFNVSATGGGGAAADTCPTQGGAHRLFQRPDDNEHTVAERLKVYEEKTKPLVEFYRNQGLLRAIKAEGSVAEVAKRLDAALGLSKRSALPRRHRPSGGAHNAPRSRTRGTPKRSR